MPRHRHSALVASLLSACWALPSRGQTPVIQTATFFGGTGNERLVAARILSDGSIVGALRVFQLDAKGKDGAFVEARLVRFDRLGKKTLWEAMAPEEVLALEVDEDDVVFALGRTRLYRLNTNTGAVAGMTTAFSGSDLLAVTGRVAAVLNGRQITTYDTHTLAQIAQFGNHIDHPESLMVDSAGGVFAGGDSNTNTGCEPYRSPQLFHFDKDGKLDWFLFNYPGPYTRYMAHVVSDSSVIALGSDAKKRLWFVGKSDGANTVFEQKHWRPNERNPYLDEGCFPRACLYPRGARTFSMIGRLMADYNEVERGSWWSAFDMSSREGHPQSKGINTPDDYKTWWNGQPTCGCKDHQINMPTSVRINGLQFHGDQVVIWGGTDNYPPTTEDAWFGRFASSGPFLGILDEDASRVRFAARIPGMGETTNASGHVRGGRLVLASSGKAEFPTRNALQPAHGGGTYDGAVLIACLGTPAECDAPTLPMPTAARPPALRPEVELPKFAPCGGDTKSTTLTAGALPDFGIDYSRAPAPAGPVDEGARDGGAADGGGAGAASNTKGAGAAGGGGGAGGGPETGGASGGRGGSGGRSGSHTGDAGGASAEDEDDKLRPRRGSSASGCSYAGRGDPDEEGCAATLFILGLLALAPFGSRWMARTSRG